MKVIEFKQQTTVIAKDQDQYISLPAEVRKNEDGEVISCWQPTFKEKVRILFGANIYTTLLTFSGNIQPQRVTIGYPEREYMFKDGNGNSFSVKESKLSDKEKDMLRKAKITFHEGF